MYGLKQSGRAWNKRLNSVLKTYGLNRSNADPCVYYKRERTRTLIIAVYVDDLLIFSNDEKERKRLKQTLQEHFNMKDLGNAKTFLGMTIEKEEKGNINIHQRNYIKNALEKFRMENCNPTTTPADPNIKLTAEMQPKTNAEIEEMSKIPYMEAVGTLLYISRISRPDISFAVNAVSRFNNNPGQAHWKAVKRIFRYLKGTINYKITFTNGQEHNITGYSDADWANNMEDSKSITGCVVKMCGGPILWTSKRQRTVALSTVEAEYIALASTCQEVVWLRELSKEIEQIVNPEPTVIHCDNNGV